MANHDPLLARADAAIVQASRLLAQLDLLVGHSRAIRRKAEQAKVLSTGLPAAWWIALTVAGGCAPAPEESRVDGS